MPILSLTDPRISRLKIPQGLETSLPGLTQGWDAMANEARNLQFQKDSLANYGTINQMVAGSTLASVGAPLGDFSVGDILWDGLMGIVEIEDAALEILTIVAELGTNLVGDFVEEAMGMVIEAMESVLEQVFQPMMDVVGAIPVFGWIAKTIWNVAMGIKKIVDLVRQLNAPPPEKEYDAAYFDPDADRNVANSLILPRISTDRDWTPLFMPPGTGKANNFGSAIAQVKLANGVGRRFTQSGQVHHPEYVGYIPGAGTIERGFEIYEGRQYFTRNLGQLYPTTRNLCDTVWAQVNRVSPAMYTVDAEKAAKAWYGHLFDIRVFLHEWSDKEGMTRTDAKNFVDGLGKQLFNWASWDQGKAGFEGDGLDPFGLNGSTPVVNLRILRDNQVKFLNQSIVAYVDEDSPAISGYWNSDYTKERWETNRQKLLSHKARCDIDLASIPDNAYRTQMEIAQETCDPPGQLALVGRPPPLNPPENPDPVQPFPEFDVVGIPSLQEEAAKGRKANPLVLMLGAAALVYGGSKIVKASK